MNKLLIICGPTSTGKTLLATLFAKKYNGELISADSRQVYKGMDVGTGKDLPKNPKPQKQKGHEYGYYKLSNTRIWGYDIADPKKGYSVVSYIKIARGIIKNIWERGKLPILVGGTGLYIKGVVDGIATAQVKPSLKLRKSLENKYSEELFEILATSDPVKAANLNLSDKKNPRRLIRAIEVSLDKSKAKTQSLGLESSVLFVGLSAPKDELSRRIEERVQKRVKAGIEKEIKNLISLGVKWGSQSMDSLGYRQWRGYFDGKNTKEEAIESWKAEEKKYAKRQITWFKKDKRINWFDLTSPRFEKSVEKLVRKWYSNDDV